MPSDSGSSRAASGGALERRKMATARNSRTAATIQSVLRVRLFMKGRQRPRYHLSPVDRDTVFQPRTMPRILRPTTDLPSLPGRSSTFCPIVKDDPAGLLHAPIDTSALFGLGYEVAILVSDLELVITRKSELDVIQDYRIVRDLLIDCYSHIRTILLKILAHLHRLVSGRAPLITLACRL